jgi:replicative DNA helicase
MEKLLPQNIEAEEGVLGSIIIDPEAVVQVADFLRPDDFYRDAHRAIFQAVLDLYAERGPADLITLCDELQRRGRLEEIGGQAYIATLVNAVPTSANVEHYARIVERTAIMRRLIHAAGQIAALAYNEADATEALDKAEQLIFAVSQRYSRSDFDDVRTLLDEYYEKLDKLHEQRGALVGLPTGFIDLDKMTGGLQKSDLIILAARPAVGKSALALSLAYNTALRHKSRVAFFALEMSKEQLVQRLLSMDSNIDQQRLRTGMIEEDEWERISHSMGKLSQLEIYIDDTAGISTMEMRSKARRLAAERGVDLVIVDYLQLMQGHAGGRNENRVQEISDISRSLKALARELNVPVLALSQLSRAVESRQSRVPQLSDLRESGCLTGESLIYLPNEGTYCRIDSLVGQSGFHVLALNTETWKLEPRPVTRAFSTGRKPVYRLKTQLGRSIRATGNHQFLTIEGWRRLDELAPGTRLALPRTLPGPQEATMSREELALLGHLIGDGCTLPRHAMQYTSSDRDLAELVAKLAVQVFGEKVAPRINAERGWYQVYLAANYRLTHRVRNPITSWLDAMGVYGLRSYEKFVPACVFKQPEAEIACFLRHLWATDGAAWCNHADATIYFATSSLQLAVDVQSLLLRLSINAKLVRVPQPGKGRDQYHIDISGKPDQERFIKLVGLVGERKQQMLEKVRLHLVNRIEKTNRDIIPGLVWHRIGTPSAGRGQTKAQRLAAATLTSPSYTTTMLARNFSRERAARVALEICSAELARLAISDVYWDKIVSIEPDGEEDVYDLTVEGLHNFLVNNIVAHNSIEQDADIVLFIYRDEVYNPESDRKNIADIIVAKHRNGPIGQFSLYFKTSQTLFRNLDLHGPQP